MNTISRMALAATTTTLALAAPTAAFAQDEDKPIEVSVGATAGIHDLGVGDDFATIGGSPIDDSGEIFGGFVAVDTSVTDNLFVGVEGNASFGTGPIDAEYGASARFGYRAEDGSKIYLRGGYQWVDLDLANLIDLPATALPAGLPDTVDDYLVGAGVEVPLGQVLLRANLDTISFDTVRATAGIGFKF
ncbi:MAG: hypothetical protein V2J14_07225 [Erythrobacter sp.]|jgi:hypothetical protein|nr:hypothetical protein [Erythrobacter sp.]